MDMADLHNFANSTIHDTRKVYIRTPEGQFGDIVGFGYDEEEEFYFLQMGDDPVDVGL